MSTTSRGFLPAAALSLAASLLSVACEVPEAPILEQRWMVPLEETVVDVEELLPSGVTEDLTAGAFDVNVPQVSVSQTLGGWCGLPCVAADGLTVPVPPFTTSFSASESLPADLVSATLGTIQVELEIANGFSFDPLENGGSLDIAVRDGAGGPMVGQLFIDGATESLPPGSVTTRTLTLTEGATVSSGSLSVTAAIDVAGGQVATIDAQTSFGVTATVDPLQVVSVTIAVAGRSVSIDAADLETAEIEEDLTDLIVSGTILLEIANPFGAGVDGAIDIGGVTKPFSIPQTPTSSLTLSYSGDELRSFLSREDVDMTGSGVVIGGPVTVTPGLELRIDATLDVTLEIGS